MVGVKAGIAGAVWVDELELSSRGRIRVHQDNLTALSCPLSPGEVVVHSVRFSTHIK